MIWDFKPVKAEVPVVRSGKKYGHSELSERGDVGRGGGSCVVGHLRERKEPKVGLRGNEEGDWKRLRRRNRQ